jgi:hypothetical protein
MNAESIWCLTSIGTITSGIIVAGHDERHVGFDVVTTLQGIMILHVTVYFTKMQRHLGVFTP